MPETIIESVLTGKLDSKLLIKWLNDESLEDISEDCILNCCNKNDFVTCFLSFLRTQTDSILQTNSNAVQILQHSTPEKLLSTRRKHRRSISDPTSEDRTMDSLSVKTDRQRSHESPSKDRKRTGRRVKTKLFNEDKSINQSASSDESRLSTGVDRLILSSTPMKNGIKPSDYPNLSFSSPVTPRSFVKEHHERCDTPRLSHRHSRSQEKSCLGDYMVNVTKSSKKKKGRSSIESDDSKPELDLTNSEMFPEIGARKASSLRSEKRRIKPTNIDKSQKSISLNSFSSESIQTSPSLVEENSAFKQQRIQVKETNSFEAERNFLKQERHKLMEKFNILNTSSPQKVIATPQIKITQKNSIEKCQSYVKSDVAMILFKDKLDLLVEIYEILMTSNLILSLNTEIYFLISILISKQFEDDYVLAQNKLKENDMGYLLKTIHNSTYFAVKSLWHQRVILEVILDKSSLKTLGENKKVRSFYPDLAKFLLNCYGIRCEAENNQDKSRQSESQSNGVVCFNSETDNIDNFPSMLSFQTFKKQRDMFYEIWRWYQETQSGGSRSSLRGRVKALLCTGAGPCNLAHLANLFTSHMFQHCLPASKQESKLSKLQRRLTCPNAPESHRLPQFSQQEMFYKDFIINAENESFRVHLRDAIASEICVLDGTHIASDERGNSNFDVTKEYLALSKKLGLLAKFLGLLASLPYTQLTIDATNKNTVTKVISREVNYATPKEKVLANDLALRNYSQPAIDLLGILKNALENGRLSISLPWIVHYLSMLDYTSLRITYYQNLLKILFDIHTNRLKIHNTTLKKNTIIYLKSILGWLFDLPHFPQELFYENRLNVSAGNDLHIDTCDLVDESVIIELCPHLRDLNVLLSTCRVSQDQKDMASYRHITPVSLTLNPEDRMKNKEKELQARLEEELLKSQPSSTRRVLELVIERVTSACVRELSAHTLTEVRERAGRAVAKMVASYQGDQANLLPSAQQIYTEHLQLLRSKALESGRASIRRRSSAAVAALLAAAPAPLVALVVRAAGARLDKWLHDNWATHAVLCKDIESEVKTLVALGDLAVTTCHKNAVDVSAMTTPGAQFTAQHVSAAACVINLKEQVCLLLDGSDSPCLPRVLSSCALACTPTNMFIRPPTQRAILQLSVDLCVVFVSRKPKDVNESFLSKLHAVWNVCCPDRKRSPPQEITLPERREELSPQFRNFEDEERAPTPISDEDIPTKIVIVTNPENLEPKSENLPLNSENLQQNSESLPQKSGSQGQESDDSDVNLEFFDRILCPRNIMLLSDGKSVDVWEAMATVLVFLLKHDYLSEDSLTEQCLAVYRQDWSQSVLESLSTCMKSVSARWSRSSTGKFTLFLDFLAEYCGDMDYDPSDPIEG
ncbi:codanin-1 [Spodoptera litura]|uniref:Codanin-1 n=1 Tax=Spodoptera litura TaxID=69820 RepID=A0A9J7E8P2_SPOLT|nr:codanin-1 [Spodoptera litura]